MTFKWQKSFWCYVVPTLLRTKELNNHFRQKHRQKRMQSVAGVSVIAQAVCIAEAQRCVSLSSGLAGWPTRGLCVGGTGGLTSRQIAHPRCRGSQVWDARLNSNTSNFRGEGRFWAFLRWQHLSAQKILPPSPTGLPSEAYSDLWAGSVS